MANRRYVIINVKYNSYYSSSYSVGKNKRTHLVIDEREAMIFKNKKTANEELKNIKNNNNYVIKEMESWRNINEKGSKNNNKNQ